MTELVERFYSNWSGIYTVLFDNPPLIKQLRRRAIEDIGLEEGDSVVEVGCGTGANFPHLRREAGEEGKVIGVDLSPGMLEKARKKVENRGWENVELVEGDGAEVELEEEFDAVLFSFSIGMFEKPDEVVEKWSENMGEGIIAIFDTSRSERKLARPLNFLLSAFTVLTAPPIYKLRYEESIPERAEKIGRRTEKKLKELSTEYREKYILYDILKLEVGEIK